jgi:hypothetical protein
MPWGGLFARQGCAQQRGFVEGAADQLQANRQFIGGEPAREDQGARPEPIIFGRIWFIGEPFRKSKYCLVGSKDPILHLLVFPGLGLLLLIFRIGQPSI